MKAKPVTDKKVKRGWADAEEKCWILNTRMSLLVLKLNKSREHLKQKWNMKCL